MFKKKERYYIYNPLSDNNRYFLTIIKVDKDVIYYFFDGDDKIQSFKKGSDFEIDLIKVVYY